jgi:hypothetical protein
MSGVGQAVFMNQRSFGPPAIGSAFEGGFFAGQISTTANSIATHNLVIGPLSTAQQASTQWKNVNTGSPGQSFIDGPQNTADVVADGNATVYPAAHFCNNLSIGGFSDWYFPALDELEVVYFNLKPTTQTNNTNSGINAFAVPARASNYTSGNPAQTSAAAFQSGGSEAFTAGVYWSSTEGTYQFGQGFRVRAWTLDFSSGQQFRNYPAAAGGRIVRAVRRVAV